MPDLVYQWDQRLRSGAGGYRDKRTGRVISQTAARGHLDNYVTSSQSTPTRLYDLLKDGRISIADWHAQMRAHVKDVNLNAAYSAVGGRAQMTQSAYGRVGQIIREQYSFLDNFAAQMASGEIPIDGRVRARSNMYTDKAVSTHEAFVKQRMIFAGFDENRSRLDPAAHHCTGAGSCKEQAARGWVKIDSPDPLIPIGRRVCLTRDRCTMEYRNSETGRVVK